jgi:ribosome-interacting GTPase 1
MKQTKGVNAEVARLICKEYRISCAEIILREDITVDQVRSYTPFFKHCSVCSMALPITNIIILCYIVD